MKNLVGLICLFVLSACHGDRAVCQTPSEIEGRGETIPGINVPRGFAVRKVAGDAVASNIYCMAVSPHGDVFVSGPGYIRVLIDSNNDGVFDNSRLFASAPKSGAQGMCFDGDSLLCTGDGGLLRFIDADRDGVSDGPARKLLDIKTGGEHDAHAIRKGPDGWWYLLAGNGTPILPEYSSVRGERDSFGGKPHANPDSPVRSPRAGFLMRISPDWKEKQIYCHGFRNAYDFDFNSLGEVFVFDSDGERDISLPWYQPTRVFRMRAGDDAGWVAAGWKRPDYFFDMPPVIGRLGRGSPTGVVVGSSKQFPNSYRDALFVADWTFGRVVAFRRDANGNYDAGTDFATASGQFGFAVTDLDMAPDGSLLVSVGGRGTEGAIYKVVYSGDRSDIELRSPSASDQFIQRSKSGSISTDDIVAALLTNDSRQCEAALEALVGNSELWGSSRSKHTESPSKIAGSVAQAISQIGIQGEVLLSRFYSTVPEDVQKLLDEQRTFGLRHELLKAIRSREGASLSTLKTVLRRLNGTDDDDSWSVKPLDLVRLGQISLGGCGKAGTDQMFIGYTPRFALQRSLDELREDADQIAMALGKFSGKAVEERLVSYELGRLAAMVGFGSNKLQTELAKRLTNLDSKATEDIHWLNCLSQVVGARSVSIGGKSVPSAIRSDPITTEVERIIAEALVGLGRKMTRDQQSIDRNFYPRLRSLSKTLIEKTNSSLAIAVANQLSGFESELFLLDVLSGESKQRAFEVFAARIEKVPAQVSVGQLGVLADAASSKSLAIIRSFSDRSEFQNVVIEAIAKDPIPADKPLLLRGLSSSNLSTIKMSAVGLRKLFDQTDANEMMIAFRSALRVGWDKPSVSVRDQLMLLLEKHVGKPQAKSFGYQFKQNKLNQSSVMERWSEWLRREFTREFAMTINVSSTSSAIERIKKIDFISGNAERGKKVYSRLQCAQCHDGGSRLGPRLEGISRRFSAEDIFKSILEPNQQVPERYRALLIETSDGQLLRGSMIYESVDGITLQKSDGGTARINKDDIESRTISPKSLMPEGLLNNASDQDLADLYQFLKSK